MRAVIQTGGDLLAFRCEVRRGLSEDRAEGRSLEELLLALTEMGTNLLRHGGGGTLEVVLEKESGLVRLEARNSPLGTLAPEPGRRGLRIGLESLGRLMDRVWFTGEDAGFGIACEKRLPPRTGGRP